MKIVHSADIHLGLTRYGHPTASGGNSRIEDFAATLDRIVIYAIESGAAALILAGDTFNSRREGPQERDALAQAARRLRDPGVSLIVLPGNHDGMATLGDPASHALRWLDSLGVPGVHVVMKPGEQIIRTRDGDLRVIAIPYPHKRIFDGLLPGYEPDMRVMEAGRRLDAMIESFLPRNPDSLPTMLVGHFTTVAAQLGSEQTMKMTWDVSVDPRVFAGYHYVALGHIHRQQQVAPNAWYAGSPDYIDFGEEDQQKGFLAVTLEPGGSPKVEIIPSEARPMRTIRFTGDDVDAIDGLPEEQMSGDIIRLQFVTPTRPRADTISRLRASAFAMGASAVVPHWKPPLTPVTRARVELAADTDRLDMLRAWLDAKGLPIEPTLSAGRDLIATQTLGE